MKRLLTEANLTNFEELTTAINKVLDDKEIPQFTGSETNKVRDWFLKQYVSAIKNDEVDLKNSIETHKYKEGEPEWMNKPDIMDFTGSLPEDVVDEIGHTVDYFATLEPNDLRKIYKQPYKVIKQKVKEWDEELASASSDTGQEDAAKKRLVLNRDYKIIKQIGGLKWVKLLTPLSKDVEGDFMGHCVGGAGYENKDIYSLWDSKNRSHVTIEAEDNDKIIRQIKGKGNREPNEKYQPACIEFVANLMYQGYTVVGDGENIDMVKHKDEYHFDNLLLLPIEYRNKPIFRQWVDNIYPTVIYPRQQKAISDIEKRIVII